MQDVPDEKEKQLLGILEKVGKALEKEFKNEERQERKIDKLFGRLLKKIDGLEKKGMVGKVEAVELREIIDEIRKGM